MKDEELRAGCQQVGGASRRHQFTNGRSKENRMNGATKRANPWITANNTNNNNNNNNNKKREMIGENPSEYQIMEQRQIVAPISSINYQCKGVGICHPTPSSARRVQSIHRPIQTIEFRKISMGNDEFFLHFLSC